MCIRDRIKAGSRTVGRLGTVVHDADYGPIALGLVKRSALDSDLHINEVAVNVDKDLIPNDDGVAPVSYTHLDVYKRQIYSMAVFTGELDKVSIDMLDVEVPGVGMVNAVSYTHLDVYKRQVERWTYRNRKVR